MVPRVKLAYDKVSSTVSYFGRKWTGTGVFRGYGHLYSDRE
jgi:hypothetical protein